MVLVLCNFTQYAEAVNERHNKTITLNIIHQIRAKWWSLSWRHSKYANSVEFRCWTQEMLTLKAFALISFHLYSRCYSTSYVNGCEKQRPLFTQAFSQLATIASMLNDSSSSAVDLTKQNETKATLTCICMCVCVWIMNNFHFCILQWTDFLWRIRLINSLALFLSRVSPSVSYNFQWLNEKLEVR